jgi:hypothetical protein
VSNRTHITCSLFLGFFLLNSGCDTISDNAMSSSGEFSRSSQWITDSLTGYWALRLWASNPTNVFVVGDDPYYVRRFNGSEWVPEKFHVTQGGTISGIITLWGVYGFSSTDVWVVGDRGHYNPTPTSNFYFTSLLAHYNGNVWTEVPLNGPGLYSIWGTSPSQMWAGGDSGQVFYYDGASWTREQTDFLPTAGSTRYYNSFAGLSDQEPYAVIYGVNGSIGYESKYLMRRIAGRWTLLDSVSSSNYGIYNLWMSPTGQLYGAGSTPGRWSGTSWIDDGPSVRPSPILFLLGTADNNRFFVGYSGVIAHFNGVDWYDVPDHVAGSRSYYYHGWTNGSRAFLLCRHENGRYLLVHN